MIAVIVILYALLGGWMISDAIKDFQKKHYFRCGISTMAAVIACTFMVYFIVKLM